MEPDRPTSWATRCRRLATNMPPRPPSQPRSPTDSATSWTPGGARLGSWLVLSDECTGVAAHADALDHHSPQRSYHAREVGAGYSRIPVRPTDVADHGSQLGYSSAADRSNAKEPPTQSRLVTGVCNYRVAQATSWEVAVEGLPIGRHRLVELLGRGGTTADPAADHRPRRRGACVDTQARQRVQRSQPRTIMPLCRLPAFVDRPASHRTRRAPRTSLITATTEC